MSRYLGPRIAIARPSRTDAETSSSSFAPLLTLVTVTCSNENSTALCASASSSHTELLLASAASSIPAVVAASAIRDHCDTPASSSWALMPRCESSTATGNFLLEKGLDWP